MSVLFVATLLAVGAAPGPYRVGVLYWSMQIPGQVVMRQGLEAEARRLDDDAARLGRRRLMLVTRVAGDGPDGVARQVEQFHELLGQKLDLLIVQPTDNAALAPALREANRLGVPVVAYDQYISGGRLASYVTSDNREAGVLDGEYVDSLFPAGRELRLVLVEYPLVSSTVERVDGFLDTLERRGRKVKVLKTYQAVEPVEGARAAAQLLRDFPRPGSVDVVFTVNDGGGLAVVSGLLAAGRREIVVATIDGDPASVKNIENGALTRIDAAQFCGPMGAEAMKVGWAVLTGGAVPREVLVPVFPVTRETRARYPGWAGPVPSAFEKPWPSERPLWNAPVAQ